MPRSNHKSANQSPEGRFLQMLEAEMSRELLRRGVPEDTVIDICNTAYRNAVTKFSGGRCLELTALS
jgi:hypothetical protein